MRLAHPSVSGPKTVEVLASEEKGSDVNLATMLMLDAFRGDFEQAVSPIRRLRSQAAEPRSEPGARASRRRP